MDGLALSGSGGVVLARAAASAPTLLDTDELLVLGTTPGIPTRPAAFLGERLHVTFPDALHVFEMSRGVSRWLDGPDGVVDLALSPAGDTLAVVRLRGAELRDVGTGALLAMTGDGARHLKGGVFASEGERWIEISSNRPNLYPHRQRGAAAQGPLPMPVVLKRIEALAGGDALTLDYEGRLRRHPATAPGEPRDIRTPGVDVVDIAADAETGQVALLDGTRRHVHLLHLGDGRVVTLGADADAFAVAISRGGRHIAAAGRGGVRVFERGAPAPTAFETDGRVVIEAAFSPDGALLAAGCLDGVVYVWDRATGAVRARVRAHRERVSALRFSPDGARLFTGSWDGRARVWSTAPFLGASAARSGGAPPD